MKEILLATVLALASIAASPSPALACACTNVVPLDRADASDFDEYVAIFSGRVVARSRTLERSTLEVLQVWKGDVPPRVVMMTPALTVNEPLPPGSGSNCDWMYDDGREYLIFALGTSPDRMWAKKCDLTAVLDEAGPGLRRLQEAGLAPRP